MANRVVGFLPACLFVAAGAYWLGASLTEVPELQKHEAINLFGLSCDVVGLAMLSRFVLGSPMLRRLIARHVTRAMQVSGLLIPFPMFFASADGFSASGVVVSELAVFLQLTFGVPAIICVSATDRGANPKIDDTTVKVVGAFFLVYGLLAQVIAAVMDLRAP